MSSFVRAQSKTSGAIDSASIESSARTRSQSAPPAISAVFTTSAKPAASSAAGSVASAAGSVRTAAG